MKVLNGPLFAAGVSSLVLSFSISANAQQVTPPDASRAPAVSGVADIVVTAQKREQSLQDVPVSITALTSEVLEANQIRNVGDLNAIAPNVTVRQSAGGAGIPAIVMRGALSIGVGPGADREVGYYVDGVYIGHANGSMFDLADIQRIEVLRGPQGTLFGRNATAGAISIVTQDPKGSFDFKQDLTYGNYDQFRSKTRIDLPAFGPFTASITYAHSERRGDTRNLGAGTVWDFSAAGLGKRTSPKWLGSENVESIAAALKFAPSDSFYTTYKFDWTDFDGTPNAQGSAGLGVTSLLGPAEPLLLGALAFQPDPSILTPFTSKRPKAVNNAFTTDMSMRISGHNLTSGLVLSDQVSVKNVMAFRRASQFSSYDLGGLGGVNLYGPLATAFGVPSGTPLLIAGSLSQFHHKQFSDEFQVNINTDLVDVTAGLLHYFQRQSAGAPQGLPNTFILTPVPGNVLYCADPATCGGPGRTKGTSNAAYVQAEVHITPQIDVVGGYRITRDNKSGSSSAGVGFKVKDTNPSYLVGLNFRPADDILLYAKYSTAFMSGGGNTGNFPASIVTYRPEKAKSWEAGAKADFFDHRLRANLALFTVKYEDLQFITSGQTCGDPTAGVCVYSAGDARAKGFEFEATAVPVERLTLSGGLGYTDFKYVGTLSPIATGATGTFAPHYRPKWTSNLAAQYETQPLIGDAHLSFRVDANYRSKSLLTPEAPAALQSKVTNGSIWILNGRVALADVAVAGHKAEIALWGRNLTNDKHMAFVNSYYFMYPTSYERARTFGVDFKFDW